MDKIDFQIINALYNDARTSFKKIAKKMGVGTDTVIRRYKKLKKEGIILKSTIVLSSQACGFSVDVGVFIKVNSGASLTKVRDELAKVPQIYMLGQLWGDYDFYFDCYLRDFRELSDLNNRLRSIKEIVTIDPMIYDVREWPLGVDFPPDFLAHKFCVQWKSGGLSVPNNKERANSR